MATSIVGREFHNTLLDQLESVGQWWPDCHQGSVSAMNAREVMTRLTELRSILKAHFQFEETHGLLPDDVSSDPRFGRESQRLLQQHNGLVDRLSAVIGSIPLVSDSVEAWSVAKSHFDDFRKILQTHEQAEIELLQSACGDNLGVGD